MDIQAEEHINGSLRGQIALVNSITEFHDIYREP